MSILQMQFTARQALTFAQIERHLMGDCLFAALRVDYRIDACGLYTAGPVNKHRSDHFQSKKERCC